MSKRTWSGAFTSALHMIEGNYQNDGKNRGGCSIIWGINRNGENLIDRDWNDIDQSCADMAWQVVPKSLRLWVEVERLKSNSGEWISCLISTQSRETQSSRDPNRNELWVGNLTATAYAILRIKLYTKTAKIFIRKAGYVRCATCVITRGVSSIFVFLRALGGASCKTWI